MDLDNISNATVPPLAAPAEGSLDPVADIRILKANLNDLFLLLMGAIILFMQVLFQLVRPNFGRTEMFRPK